MIKFERGWFEYSLWKFPKGSNDVPILTYISLQWDVHCTLYSIDVSWRSLRAATNGSCFYLGQWESVGEARIPLSAVGGVKVEGDGGAQHWHWLDTEIWSWVKDEHKNIEEIINEVRLGGKLRTSLSAQDIRVWLDIYVSPCCVFSQKKNYHSSEKDDMCLRVPSRPPSRPHNGLMRHILHHNGDASCFMHLHNLLLWNWHCIYWYWWHIISLIFVIILPCIPPILCPEPNTKEG